MKSQRFLRWIVVLVALLFVTGGSGPLLAEEQAIDMQNFEKLAQEGFAQADGTRQAVQKVLDTISQEAEAAGASNMLKDEVADAKYWFKRANDLLVQCKKQMDEKKFDKNLVLNLNQSWQWFVKAGSAAVRASMMP